MINKLNNMSKILKLSGAAFLAILLASCGASSKEEKGALTDKKAELKKLKTEQSAVNDKVRKLEEEIAKLDTTAVSKTKLVAVTPLAQQNFTHYIDLQGKVDAENISYIAPRGTPGQVKELYIKQGDYVKKGQLILKMEDALARQGVASAKQNAEGIKTSLELAKNLYQRQKTLWDQGIGTQVQLLESKGRVDMLESQLKSTVESIKMAEEQLSQTTVYSDVSGIAEVVSIRVGELFQGATAAGPQIRIVNTSDLKAVVEVPENYLASIKKGTAVVIEVGGINKQFNSTISRIGQIISANSRAVTAEAKIPSDPSLKPNQLVTVKIRDYAVNNTIVIPMTTLQTDENGKYVYVMVSEKGKQIARKRPVTIGQIYGEQIEIKSGLQSGEQLITQGYQGVYDGQTVTTQG
jgi:RND family efflux transporter MFP subunit